jgi:hypothetical protein
VSAEKLISGFSKISISAGKVKVVSHCPEIDVVNDMSKIPEAKYS